MGENIYRLLVFRHRGKSCLTLWKSTEAHEGHAERQEEASVQLNPIAVATPFNNYFRNEGQLALFRAYSAIQQPRMDTNKHQ